MSQYFDIFKAIYDAKQMASDTKLDNS